MDEKEKFEANKRHNAPFLRALDVLMKEKNLTQGNAAKLLDTKSGTFSDYKSGKKKAGPEMFGRIARAFDGRLNMHYLTGESEYMLLANVPDEEILEYTQRESNPDFDVQNKAKTTNSTVVEQAANIIDLYAGLIKEIESLRADLTAELAAARKEREEAQRLTEMIHECLFHARTIISKPAEIMPIAAESNV